MTSQFFVGLSVALTIDVANSSYTMQGHRQWIAEVQFLGVLEHPNIKLKAFCAPKNTFLLSISIQNSWTFSFISFLNEYFLVKTEGDISRFQVIKCATG